jgi:hypothetical protein
MMSYLALLRISLPTVRCRKASSHHLHHFPSRLISTLDHRLFHHDSKRLLPAPQANAQAVRHRPFLEPPPLQSRRRADRRRHHLLGALAGKVHPTSLPRHLCGHRKLAKSMKMRQRNTRVTTTLTSRRLCRIRTPSKPTRATPAWRITPCNRRSLTRHHQAFHLLSLMHQSLEQPLRRFPHSLPQRTNVAQ